MSDIQPAPAEPEPPGSARPPPWTIVFIVIAMWVSIILIAIYLVNHHRSWYPNGTPPAEPRKYYGAPN